MVPVTSLAKRRLSSKRVELKASQDQIYEYACHEGNYGMEGILRAARAKDGAANDGAK